MRFFWIQNPLECCYNLEVHKLDTVEVGRDFTVNFDRKLDFSYHTQTITQKAFRILGFVKSKMRDFSDASALKLVYITTVGIMEYSSVTWSPHDYNRQDNFARVQRKFLR